MDIAQDIKDRIVAAANSLYEEAARAVFPTVAAVRARAAADMNAASIVMREWRRAQTVQAAPVVVDVPDRVRAANLAALASLWSEAQALANEGLLSAQAAWAAERGEAETLRGELSEAFEGQLRELEGARALIAGQAERLVRQEAEGAALRVELARVNELAGMAEVRAAEIERRANDLAGELARVHAEGLVERERQAGELARVRADLDLVRGDLVGARASVEVERGQHAELRRQAAEDALRLAGRLGEAEAGRDLERGAASKAREEAARLQGMVDAMASEHAQLMRAVVAAGDGGRGRAGDGPPAAA